MDSKRKLKLGDVLILNNVINENDLEKALALQKGTWKKLGEVLVDQGIVTEEQIASSLSIQLGLELVQLNNIVVPPEVLQLVPVSVLKKNKVFPISFAPNNINILQVAMADPMDMNAMDDISIITNCQVEPVVATSREVLLAIDKFYRHDDVSSALEAYAKEKNLDGINQVQVNPKADLTFASALRSILRQDPDIIMVGEIRDKETATIAVQVFVAAMEPMIILVLAAIVCVLIGACMAPILQMYTALDSL